MAGARDVGRVAGALRAAGAARAARARSRAARAGGLAADGGRRAGRSRRGPRRAVGAAAAGRGRPAGATLRARVRGQPGAGAGPGVPRRVRPGRGRARVPAESRARIRCCRIASARGLGGGLQTRADRAANERQLLHLAVGAATERLYLVVPAPGRGGVARACAVVLCARRGARASPAACPITRSWPPRRPGLATRRWRGRRRRMPAEAIDEQEHDLAVLRGLLDAGHGEPVRGQAQYLLRLNEALRRTVTERWARAAPSGRSTTAWCGSPTAHASALASPAPCDAATIQCRRCSALPRAPTSSCSGAFCVCGPPSSRSRCSVWIR